MSLQFLQSNRKSRKKDQLMSSHVYFISSTSTPLFWCRSLGYFKYLPCQGVFERNKPKKKLQQQYLSHIFFPHIELVIVTIQIIKTSMRETPFVTLRIIIVVFFSFLIWQKWCPYVRWNDNDESVILEQFKVKAS